VTTLDVVLTATFNEAALEEILASRDLDARDPHGATALWHAVYFGRPEWVARLLDAGASLDAHDPVAIDRTYGSGHIVSIWRGVSENAPAVPSGRGTLLHVAATRVGSPEVGALLLDRGVDVNAPDRFGDTALHIAAFAGNVAMIEFLLERGADVHAVDRAGYTALDHTHFKLEAIQALLRHRASPDGGARIPWPHSSLGHSLLTQAATYDRVDVLDALLEAGAKIAEHPDALPSAAKLGATAAVRRLLKARADTFATIEWRGRARPPLEAAAMYASTGCVAALIPHCRDELDRALETCVEFSSEDSPSPPNNRLDARRECVGLLLDAGASPTAALHAAAQVAEPCFSAELLKRGADMHALDARGYTALLCAAERGRPEAAKVLLAAGADAHARTPAGESVYETARRAYRDEKIDDARLVMRALEAVGAAPPPTAPPPAKPAGITPGSTVRHAKFGDGKVVASTGAGDEQKLTIEFATVGTKTLLARFVSAVTES
jgi:ankyrin repeat protein